MVSCRVVAERPTAGSASDWRCYGRIRGANCGQKTSEIHHVLPLANGGSDEIHNLKALCRKCHYAAHGKNMRPRFDDGWITLLGARK